MPFRWRWSRQPALLPDGRLNTASSSKHQSPSFMSAVYDQTVRTNSYNEFLAKIGVLVGDSRAEISPIFQIDGLLEPNQEAVDAMLGQQMDCEMPEIMKMALDFFDSSRKASALCGTLMLNVHTARRQCGRMEATLAQMPISGEVIGFMQQQEMAEGLSELVEAENPFSAIESKTMFMEVRDNYGVLSGEVEDARKVVGRKVRVVHGWRCGCIAVVLGAIAGAIVFAIVLASHAVVSVAAAPVFAAAAVMAERKISDKKFRNVNKGFHEVSGMEKNSEVSRGTRKADKLKNIRSHGYMCCCGMSMLKRQSARLEALSRGSFTVNRMLDTLRCLVAGLQDDVERNHRLVEFGWRHREEALCVQQVGKQLYRSHMHLVRQLANLEEQIVVCFLIINKARDNVFQEFSP